MKRIIIILVVLSCTLGMNAQTETSRNQLEQLKKAKEQVEQHKKKVQELEDEYHHLLDTLAEVQNRQKTPEQSLKEWLAKCKSIKDLADNNIFAKNQNLCKLDISKTYLSLIEMYNSLGEKGGYDHDQNESFKSELENITEQLDPNHIDSFKESVNDLKSCIKKYRFTLFELARIFAVVKEKEKSGLSGEDIYKSLQADNETYFVDLIPYTKKMLSDYIKGNQSDRAEIIRTLKASCSEAFKKY